MLFLKEKVLHSLIPLLLLGVAIYSFASSGNVIAAVGATLMILGIVVGDIALSLNHPGAKRVATYAFLGIIALFFLLMLVAALLIL